MLFKRKVIDHLIVQGIKYFILIGENVFNFHGAFEDDYYAEWFEEVEDGWIAGINFAEFVTKEWSKYNLDFYLNFGGSLDFQNWRTTKPELLFAAIHQTITKRLN